ncbi:hypothetical protein [Nocardia camponoti]|nr:hypothetical protein [Nocardia camponoti]
MTPEQLHALIDRLVFTDERLEVELASDTEADCEPGMWARPIAMTDDLDLRSQLRARELQLSRSAYIRRLVEQDLKAAYGREQPNHP